MLKIGIIGAGGISDSHIRGYLDLQDQCEIIAICDTDPARAEAKRLAFGLVDARVYGDAAELLAQEKPDLVSIATPPASHAELTIRSLRAGSHVLVEKPMAPSLEQCDAMLEAQRESGRLLSVVAQNRFRDDMAGLKAVLDSGLIGSLSHVSIDSTWWRARSYYDLWWRGTWESEGGGPTLNHAIHHIDLMLWLLGRPSEVAAMMNNAQHDNAEVEDISVAIFRYGRALAELTSSVVHHGEEQEIIIHGQRARVSQPWRAVATVGEPNGFPSPTEDDALVAKLDSIVADREPLDHLGHTGQIADLIRAISEGGRPLSDGTDGRNAVEIVTAIYEAAIEGHTVRLPLSADDPYYRTGRLPHVAPRFFKKTASLADLGGDIVVGASSDAAARP